MLPISHLRLQAQQIENSRFGEPGELVKYMGAIQAQDFAMSKWAVGCRVPGSTEADVQAALDRGEILRTHVLRPTWHLVSAADIHWMLALTAPHIKASMRSLNKKLELTPELFVKSHRCLEKVLGRGEHLTRTEIKAELERVKINTADNRLSHLLAEAELDGLICSGVARGNTQTYAWLPERAPDPKKWTRDEALEELARRYFTGHGPAGLDDFRWWSGLPAKDARHAFETVKPTLAHEIIDGITYLWDASLSAPKKSGIHLLPAFDEFIISYKNRTASLATENHARAVSINGLFRPTVVGDGKVSGLWKPIPTKTGLSIETDFFDAVPKSSQPALTRAQKQYFRFLAG